MALDYLGLSLGLNPHCLSSGTVINRFQNRLASWKGEYLIVGEQVYSLKRLRWLISQFIMFRFRTLNDGRF